MTAVSVKPSLVYTTYIASTQERVWQAIVDPELAREYWKGSDPKSPARVNVSDWKEGSTWEHRRADETRQVDICGTVLESDPPRKLVMSWARPKEMDDESKHSRVTFEIESLNDTLVKFVVIHDDLEKDPSMLNGVSNGWPLVLSNLKTFLETGRSLPQGRVGA